MPYFYLLIAIAAEVIATSALKMTDNFSKLWPSVIVILGYITSFYFLSLTLRTFSLGVAYALWAGLGVVLVTVASFVIYKQRIDFEGIAGIGLIIMGVIILNVFSNSTPH
jgi:small multidrug resistance pump